MRSCCYAALLEAPPRCLHFHTRVAARGDGDCFGPMHVSGPRLWQRGVWGDTGDGVQARGRNGR